jgi:hypothetical protein
MMDRDAIDGASEGAIDGINQNSTFYIIDSNTLITTANVYFLFPIHSEFQSLIGVIARFIAGHPRTERGRG